MLRNAATITITRAERDNECVFVNLWTNTKQRESTPKLWIYLVVRSFEEQKANRNNALHDDTNVKIEITLNGRMKAPISNPTIENQH